MSWGDIIGKVFDWIPGRSEYDRKRIDDIKHEIDALLLEDDTPANRRRMDVLVKQLRKHQANLERRAK